MADTAQRIAERPPIITKTSPRQVDAVSGCLENRFLSFGSDLRVIRGENRADLLFAIPQMGADRYPWKVSVRKTGGGATTEARRSDIPFPRLPEAEMREAIEDCAA
ncbi:MULTISPECIES: hypothetical protein [unclassified Caballeronia]|uniref:hypothetical protein n=1 Tax=unclassified Caballeronia TaxID=2646786 RepID=UPI00285996FB|nr:MULTISPECIES: hypothetical protein [unclassified Caballeronia]MDR5776252.1 hypothetical protein [Caballeronia sp. LZ002]MDR5851692.1 hypothetical protein [Caballeronia sp. LZ003]